MFPDLSEVIPSPINVKFLLPADLYVNTTSLSFSNVNFIFSGVLYPPISSGIISCSSPILK